MPKEKSQIPTKIKPINNLKKMRRKLAFKISLIIIGVAFIFALGFGLGFGSASGINLYQIINKDSKTKTIDFSLFWKVWDEVHNNYLHSYDDKTLFYSSIKGLVAGLNDPYSNFLDPTETKAFNQDMAEQFGGVGIEITMKDSKVVVVSALKGSPAESTGIKSGDQILSVDSKTTQGIPLMTVLTWIRGDVGTKVKVEFMRDGWSKSQTFEFTRYKVSVDSVKWSFDNNLAYVQINQFSDNTTTLMQKAASDIVQKNPKGIILDLRGNPGGLLTSAVDVASLFIEKGAVLYQRDRNNNDQAYNVSGNAKLKNFPMVILIDKGSASEILAGALSYYHKGTLIGETSFGKGVMQDYQTFPDGSSLDLTVAFWLTPGKVGIDKKGITPDITIKSDKTDCSSVDMVCNKAKTLLVQ